MAAEKLDARTGRAARDIGRRLRAARLEAGLSQEKLAAKIGMTRGNYARIERGGTNVTLETMLRITAGLELELSIRFNRSRGHSRGEPAA